MIRTITHYLMTGLLGLAVCLFIGSCRLTPESGQFYCESKDDCPPDWICRPDEDGKNKCYDDLDQDGSDTPNTDDTGTETDSDTDAIETDTTNLPPCPGAENLFCKNPVACKSPNVPHPDYRCDKENDVCCGPS